MWSTSLTSGPIVGCNTRLSRYVIVVALLVLSPSHPATATNNTYHTKCVTSADVKEDHWLYVAEIGPEEFTKRARAESVDQRLVEGLAFAEITHPVTEKIHVFNTKDPAVIAEYDRFTSGPKVNNDTCAKQLAQMVALLEDLGRINQLKRRAMPSARLNESHFRLARVMDSYGRYLSGSQQLRYASFGSHEQCLRTQLQLDPEHPADLVTTRVCMATLNKCTQPLDETSNISPKDLLPKMGICLPSSCHSKSLGWKDNKRLIQKLIDSQIKLPRSVYVHEHREVLDLFCLNDNNESDFGVPLTGKLVLAALAAWVLVILLLNLLQVHTWSARGWNWLIVLAKCVHLRSLLESFLAHDKASAQDANGQQVTMGEPVTVRHRRVNLFALNFVKVLGTMTVVYAHGFMVMTITAADVTEVYRGVEYDARMLVVISLNMVVDSFFVISGMLSIYLTAKKFDRRKINFLSTSLFIILARYSRLVPLFFLAFLLKRYVLMYIGYGPMWDHGFNLDTVFGNCKSDTWISSFTPMLFEWQSSMEQCIGQGWSIRGEIFALLITTPLIVLIFKAPKLAVALASLVGLVANIVLFQAFDQLDVKYGRRLSRFEPIVFVRSIINDMTAYNRSHFRIGSVLIGLVAGHFVYQYEKGVIKEWPRWFRRYAAKLSLLCMANALIAFSYTRAIFRSQGGSRLNIYPHLSVSNRIIWALANAVVFTRMVTDWRDYYAIKLFNGRFLQTMSKLSYSILLMHLDLSQIDYYNKMIRVNLSYGRNMMNAGAVYMQAVFLGFFVHLLIESPLDNLFKVLLSSRIDAAGTKRAKPATIKSE